MGFYDRYRGTKRKQRQHRLLVISIALLLVMLAAVTLLVLGDHITYSADGFHFTWGNLPDQGDKPVVIPDDPDSDPDGTDDPDYVIDGSTQPGGEDELVIVQDPLTPLESVSGERQYAPEFVMLHFSSAVVISKDDPYNVSTIRSIFTDYKVSAHYLIDRDGTVYCLVPEDRVAWHAGTGTWNNDAKYQNTMNQYAIGIEMLAIGSQADMAQYLSAAAYQKLDPSLIGYTDAQYASLKLLVEDICQRNQIPMTREHVIGHEEYSSKKSDPGDLFDWSRLFS